MDFAPAPDYVEPTRQTNEEMEVAEESMVADSHGPGHFRAFGGSGNRYKKSLHVVYYTFKSTY